MLGWVLVVGRGLVEDVGRRSIISGLKMGRRRRGRISIYLVCTSYDGSTSAARGELGILGCWNIIGVFPDSIVVGSGWINIGVARLRNCRVRDVWFLKSWGFCWTL